MSTEVREELDRIDQNIANTYSVLEEAGAEMPQTRNSNNLPGTAASISAVLYGKEQTLTSEQKAQARENIGAKTPYEYAQDAGYTGTEEEFAEKLASGSLTVMMMLAADDSITADKTVAECFAAFQNGIPVYGTVIELEDGDSYAGAMVTCLYDDTGTGGVIFECVNNSADNGDRLVVQGLFEDGVESWIVTARTHIPGGNVDPEQVNTLIDTKLHSVTTYGAKGDGVANDTTAFQNALAKNRIVTVPGGTYLLSDTLVIRENCCLELSQDTVLQFTQTAGNCIEMRGSAVLRGNHAVISAAFGLTGNVISMDTLQDGTNHASIPPYAKADPQWKRQRFVYDVNIIKPNSSGFNRPLADGVCRGTAIYMSATNVPTGTDNPNNADIPFMWGITMSGIRIAGGFSYGIHAVNYDTPAGSSGHYADDAWNHDMRIEAVIEGCEVGVCLDNCNGAHLNVTVQPTVSNPGSTKYAKQGVCLRDSRFVDMMRSRVWDWQVARNDSAEYQHLALYGNCRGLLLDDFLVHEQPGIDIRDQIYTNTPSNFDTMTILQEPSNKYFKSVDGVPYFNNGTTDRKLMLATDKFSAEQAEFIHPADGYYTYTPNFKNLVQGYTDGQYLLSDGTTATINDRYTTTDFIAIDPATTHTYRIGGEGIVWKDAYSYGRIAWYDADKNIIGQGMSWNKVGSSTYYPAWVEDETVESAFETLPTQAIHGKAAYFRLTVNGSGANLIVTIDEPQEYNAIWHGEPKRLDESIHAVTDWNASEGEVGHVLNRTHCKKFDSVIPEMDISPDEFWSEIGLENVTPFEEGETYRVNWNGTKSLYKAYADTESGSTFVGNLALGGDDPFSLITSPGFDDEDEAITSFIVAPMDESTAVTLSVEKLVYEKIPFDYLPDSLRSYTVVPKEEEITDSTIWELSETADIAARVLYYGGTVYIDCSSKGAIAKSRILDYIFVPVEGNTTLAANILHGKSIVSVMFEPGTWTPPTT